MVTERLTFLVGVHPAVALVAIQHVVGHVVVRPQPVGSVDASIYQLRHRLVVFVVRQPLHSRQLFRADGFTQRHMYAALPLHDACHDAVQVLTGLLRVSRVLRLIQFQRLQHLARLPFVGDGDGHDVQFRQCLHAVFVLAHAEHLYNALVRAVNAVLCPSVALGNPHRLALFPDGIADIFREV